MLESRSSGRPGSGGRWTRRAETRSALRRCPSGRQQVFHGEFLQGKCGPSSVAHRTKNDDRTGAKADAPNAPRSRCRGRHWTVFHPLARDRSARGIIRLSCSSVRGPTRTEPKQRTLGANWIRPGSLKCRWRAVVGQRATLKADQKLNCRVIISQWPPRDRLPRLRAFAGEARLPAAIPDRLGSPSATPGIKNRCRLAAFSPRRLGVSAAKA